LEASPIVFVKLHLIRKNKTGSSMKPNEIPEQHTIEGRKIKSRNSLQQRGEKIAPSASSSSLSSKVFSKLPH